MSAGLLRDQLSMARAVSAMGSRSQLINAAAATQGEAASIMPSHGRCSSVRTWAQMAINSRAPSSTVLTSTKIKVEARIWPSVRSVPC